MHNYLINLGVKEEDIISDLQGNSTYETLVRVKEFVKDKSVIFCTQELYSYRAIYIAKKIDLDLNVFCADSVIYSHNIRNYVRETFSKVKAVLDCNFSFTKVNSLES